MNMQDGQCAMTDTLSTVSICFLELNKKIYIEVDTAAQPVEKFFGKRVDTLDTLDTSAKMNRIQ